MPPSCKKYIIGVTNLCHHGQFVICRRKYVSRVLRGILPVTYRILGAPPRIFLVRIFSLPFPLFFCVFFTFYQWLLFLPQALSHPKSKTIQEHYFLVTVRVINESTEEQCGTQQDEGEGEGRAVEHQALHKRSSGVAYCILELNLPIKHEGRGSCLFDVCGFHSGYFFFFCGMSRVYFEIFV